MKHWALALLATSLFTTLGHAAGNLHIGERTVTLGDTQITEATFRDDQGREVYLRGWNVSGSVKLASRGFKPFESREDAAKAFELMKRHTGANLVRFTVSWEGAHPGPDQIDYAYVDAIIEQMRRPFARKSIFFWITTLTSIRGMFFTKPRNTLETVRLSGLLLAALTLKAIVGPYVLPGGNIT